MLACLGDGTKLPPYIVFKRKTIPKNLNLRCQEKGWMDERLVQDWLRTVWNKVGGLTRRKSLLVWDLFRTNLSRPIHCTLKLLHTEPAVIPGGMTSMLQPPDVSVNKPIKDCMRVKWQQWMMAGEHTCTTSGQIDPRGLGRHISRINSEGLP